jgi:hypothetical protein
MRSKLVFSVQMRDLTPGHLMRGRFPVTAALDQLTLRVAAIGTHD